MDRFETIADGVYEYTLFRGKWYYLMNKHRRVKDKIHKEILEGTIVGVMSVHGGIQYKLEKMVCGNLNERYYVTLGEEIETPVEVIAKLVLE